MKTTKVLVISFGLIIFSSCRSEPDIAPLTAPWNTNTDNYFSLSDFHTANGVSSIVYSMDAGTAYSFTTLQGTHVSIPSNAFVTLTGSPVSGTVHIEFKDVYKKSDMLLTDLSTTYHGHSPMVSAGMFFIKATVNGNAVKLTPGQRITISQPIVNALPPDTGMKPMVFLADSIIGPGPGGIGWFISPIDTLQWNTTKYIFSLYKFNTPEDSGTWCNSDNPTYFSAYPNTTLTLHTTDVDTITTDVFLVFTGINSMIHVYRDYINVHDFPYNYAPVGLPCTVVCVGVRDGKVFSSFTPITISANQTVNFTMTETTTDAFKSQLNTLN